MKLAELAGLSEKAALDRLVRGYWPAVGDASEQHYLALGEGGVSSRALPLDAGTADFLYALAQWYRENKDRIAVMEEGILRP